MKFRNCTAHIIVLIRPDGSLIEIPPSGMEARCENLRECLDAWEGIPVVRSTLGAVTGLPPFEEGISLLVSQMVAAACPERVDLYFPTDIVRDDTGVVLGARSIARI